MTKRDDSSGDASFKEIRELLSDSDAVKRQRGAALAYIKYLPYVTSKLGIERRRSLPPRVTCIVRRQLKNRCSERSFYQFADPRKQEPADL